MDQFKEIIDFYFENYSKFEKGKVDFECEYGELVFYKENSELLVLHGIYISPQHRNKGLCREILHYIIDKCQDKYKYFLIQSVISKILYNYLLRFNYNEKKFKNIKMGFVYKI